MDANITPGQRLTLSPPKVMDLAAFGCRAIVSKPPTHQHKPSLSERGWVGAFLGRSRDSPGCYDVWVSGRVVRSSSVLVNEEYFDWLPADGPSSPLRAPLLSSSTTRSYQIVPPALLRGSSRAAPHCLMSCTQVPAVTPQVTSDAMVRDISACGTLATRKVRLVTWRGTVDMDGSADAPPTKVAATVVPRLSACPVLLLLLSSRTYSIILYPRHPQFPKYTYLEMGGCIYAYIQLYIQRCIYRGKIQVACLSRESAGGRRAQPGCELAMVALSRQHCHSNGCSSGAGRAYSVSCKCNKSFVTERDRIRLYVRPYTSAHRYAVIAMSTLSPVTGPTLSPDM